MESLVETLRHYEEMLDKALTVARIMNWQIAVDGAFLTLDKTCPDDVVLNWYCLTDDERSGWLEDVNFPIRLLTATDDQIGAYKIEVDEAKRVEDAEWRRQHALKTETEERKEYARLRKKFGGK